MTKSRLHFLQVSKFWLFAMLYAVNAFAEEKTYLDYSEVKCENSLSPNCYQEVICNIDFKTRKSADGQANDCANFATKDFYKFSHINGYSKILYGSKKTKTTIVSVHGLWGGWTQFSAMLDPIYDLAQPNAIELTLPGHPKRDTGSPILQEEKKLSSKFEDWLVAIEETLRIAKELGEKTIIVGHSTGGLLAIAMALKHPNLVDATVLIEPSLRVRSLVNWGACFSKNVPDVLINGVGKLLGRPISKTVDIEMGCEVQKLADQVFSQENSYAEVARQIRTPILMINNEYDEVVSPDINREFFAELKSPKAYVSLNKDGSLAHGTATFSQASFLTEKIAKFAFFRLPGSEIARVHRDKISERISDIISTTTIYQKLNKSVYVDSVISLKEDLCQIAEQIQENCREFEEALDVMVKFYFGVKSLQSKVMDAEEAKMKIYEMRAMPSPEQALFEQKLQYLQDLNTRMLNSSKN